MATPLDACPASATIGSAEAASPLTAAPLRGPVVLKQNPARGLPDLVVNLKGAAPLTLVGRPDFVGNRVRNTFPGAPDVPLSRFTLNVNGGKGGLLLAAQDLCRPDKKQVRDGHADGLERQGRDPQGRRSSHRVARATGRRSRRPRSRCGAGPCR